MRWHEIVNEDINLNNYRSKAVKDGRMGNSFRKASKDKKKVKPVGSGKSGHKKVSKPTEPKMKD